MKDTLIRFLLAWSLIATCLLFMNVKHRNPCLSITLIVNMLSLAKLQKNEKSEIYSLSR